MNVSVILIPFSLCQVFVMIPSSSLQNKAKWENEWIKIKIKKKKIEEL